MANSKCALRFEDKKFCEGLSSAVNATCQTFSTQICKAARNEHNEKCISSWKLAGSLKNGSTNNMGETAGIKFDSGAPWVKGGNGQSCDTVCSAIGKYCDAAKQSTLTTNELVRDAFAAAGYTCKGFHGARGYAGSPFSTGRNEDCAPIIPGKTSSCTDNAASNHAALCYCQPDFWKQCRSENGARDCAKCDASGGALPCSKIPIDPGPALRSPPSDAPDDLTNARFFIPAVTRIGSSKHKAGGLMATVRAVGSSCMGKVYYGQIDTSIVPAGIDGKPATVLTRCTALHPNAAGNGGQYDALDIVILGLKRTICHDNKCDVFKISYCIKCPTNIIDSNWASTIGLDHTKVVSCVSKAFTEGGSVKDMYKCSASDDKHALMFGTTL